MTGQQRICVYCASSDASDAVYRDVARRLGGILAARGYAVIYGGGATGSMGALADGGEHFRQALQIATPGQFGAGVGERGDRRQRVVQFVADDADHLLPGRHFLPRQLARHAPHQVQAVRSAL